MNVPVASLTPQAAAEREAQAKNDIEAIRWCNKLGMPFIMGDRVPLDIQQSPSMVAMIAKVPSSARYIYSDGRPHPGKDEYEPSTNGHSIGHWEGDTFVVDTVSFNDRGAIRIPGGGIRTPDSHLVERYRLLENGQRLSVTFTWEDPKVFQKPHTYEFRYYRIAQIPEPRIYGCDSSDEVRAGFLTGSGASSR